MNLGWETLIAIAFRKQMISDKLGSQINLTFFEIVVDKRQIPGLLIPIFLSFGM
jgi:hypothetical protein